VPPLLNEQGNWRHLTGERRGDQRRTGLEEVDEEDSRMTSCSLKELLRFGQDERNRQPDTRAALSHKKSQRNGDAGDEQEYGTSKNVGEKE